MKTLAEIFCADQACDESKFRARILHECLPLHVRLLAFFLGGAGGTFFEPDRELIAGVAKATTMDAVRNEISDFFLHPANKSWLRTVGGFRVSTKRLKAIARHHFSEDRPRSMATPGS